MSKKMIVSAVALALLATNAFAGGHCASGKTLEKGKFTIATGNPAYFPWVMDDAPESGQGFEAAVGYAVAKEMGFAKEDVVWVRSSFDEAIQPGVKNFDVNMQQYSITDERDQVVDFSVPYYTAPMAVLVGSTTAVQKIASSVKPNNAPLLYADNADVNAAITANQIDAAMFDLPTALFLSAVMIEGSKVIGQFPSSESDDADQFGMLMEEGNPLKSCVDTALNSITKSGILASIEAQWLQDTTGVPLIK